MERQINIPESIRGLNEKEVLTAREKWGSNEQRFVFKDKWWHFIFDIVKEPMLILLIAVAVIYFILGQLDEAWFMVAALIAVSGISIYQDRRSGKALEALKKLNEPLSKVLRNGHVKQIATSEIVVGDLIIAEEGSTINADGVIVHSNDFSVNESSLTGEAYSVFKSATSEDSKVYSGTMVASGLALYEANNIGTKTRIGQLGASLADIREEATPLQKQISRFVKIMAIFGVLVFLLVWIINFWQSKELLDSLLKGLTLAMSILPEEIPVAFTTFMALGSWRLMRQGIIVKKTRTVEALGSATVICTDKTGTITENKMSLKAIYAHRNNKLYENENWNEAEEVDVIEAAMWASEPIPFDPMEKTLHRIYQETTATDNRRSYQMVHEYPLEGKPPMMTHVFENADGQRIISAKGAPEAIINASELSPQEKKDLNKIIESLAVKGYRILGVATAEMKGNNYPEKQESLPFHFKGFVAFYDPPKDNIREVFNDFKEAGIVVKIITGDNALTTKAIARQAGVPDAENVINGEELMRMDETAMTKTIHDTTVFTRMFPEAKLAIVNALKKDNQVVAMIGDGVNDGPALKASHIGIAMGQKGTEIAKSAADLILVNDDLNKLVDAVASGRRIYTNIKKAVQYIISIHIPIIFTVSLPLFLGWIYPNIFTPVHVIFLELIMGPMCSIVYENEPMEKNTMQQPPRQMSSTFLTWKEMRISILQGIIISAGVLFIYQYAVQNGASESLTRSMVFSTLVIANIFLSLVNRSFYYSFITTLKNRNPLMLVVNLLTIILLIIILNIPVVADFFNVEALSSKQLLIVTLTSAFSVLWIEGWKWWNRIFKRD